METDTTTKTGTGNAGPATEEIKWISLEEAEELEKHIFKNYTRKGAPAEAKKFFFRITGMHPYSPSASGAMGADNNRYQFEVQKYYRNKFRDVTTRDSQNPENSRREKVNVQVDAHEFNERTGRWVCVDPQASFFMDTEKFLSLFEPDKE